MIDLIEHLEDYFSFLRQIKDKADYKLFHIPLDLSVNHLLRKRRFENTRHSVGHIHYFTKDLVLDILKETGYEVLDYFYTNSTLDFPAKSILSRFGRVPRRILKALSPDLAARWMGGFSLLLLAK